MARISAAEAAQIIREDQAKINNGRILPPTLKRIRRLQEEETFPICNVGPWGYKCERGCLVVFIPPYDPKADTESLGYSKSDPMPTVRREAKIVDEHEYTYFEDDGRAVAGDLVGVGFGMPPQNSLTQYGVFIPEGPKPTRQELADAREKLSLYMDRLIEEARDAFDKGPDERRAVISDRHLLAARTKGVQERWVHHQHTQESVACQMCGKFNPSGIAKCQCGCVIDIELYTKIKAQQDAIEAKLAKK